MNRSTLPLAKQPAADLPEPAECCIKCKFVADLMPKSMLGALLCRRFPPVVTLIAVPVNPPNGVLIRPGQPQPMTFANQPLYPPVNQHDWCGEYQLGDHRA